MTQTLAQTPPSHVHPSSPPLCTHSARAGAVRALGHSGHHCRFQILQPLTLASRRRSFTRVATV